METEDRQRPEEKTEQEATPAAQPEGAAKRSYILWIFAGIYIFYTGFQLCESFLKGNEESTLLFMAIGVVFVIIGAALLFFGGRGMIHADKAKRAMEDTQADDTQEVKEEQTESAEETETGKKRSITDRAKLVQELEETDDDK